jgi:2-polyprenyl-3-methyl-5-hydroxy-6-metoxy-1,4-benzoquinol methylase
MLSLECGNLGATSLSEYTGYIALKAWDAGDFMRPRKDERTYYSREFRGHRLKGKRVLEVGFGNGSFLGWARDQGAQVHGTEIQPELRRRAEAAEVHLEPSDLSEMLPDKAKTFDVIVAFDVFEHIELTLLPDLLADMSELLTDGGLLVARYPNGESPFGRIYQYGDLTHVSVLSASIMKQLVKDLPFEVVRLGNPARPSGLIHVIRSILQRAIEMALHGIYLYRDPVAPNSIAVLRRIPRSATTEGPKQS